MATSSPSATPRASTKEGFQPHQLTINGAVNSWYFGNIIFGGLIGMLAVDP